MVSVTLHSYQSTQHGYSFNNSPQGLGRLTEEEALEAQKNEALSINSKDSVSLSAGLTSGQAFQQKVSGVDTYNALGSSNQSNPYANTILNSIELQLARDVADGATQEELQSRLEAGLEGFLDGYGDAYDQLKASGMLSEQVMSEISDTKERVLAGLSAMANEHGLTLDLPESLQSEDVTEPGTAAVSGASAIESLVNSAQTQQLSYGVGQLRDFSFSLETADGDIVKINAQAMQVGVSYLEYGGGNGTQVGTAGMQDSSFAFSVDGELDEGELSAINDLLKQVNGITDTFFNGDVQDAFEMALEIGFDSEEIASFALNVSRTDIEKVQSAYGVPSADESARENGPALPGMGHKMVALSDLVKQLYDAQSQVSLLGQDNEFLTNLTEQISQIRYQDEEKTASLTEFMNSFV